MFTDVYDEQDQRELRRADVYSVGALMYRVLTFRRPWHHLEEVRAARREAVGGGHHETKNIIKSEVSLFYFPWGDF